MIVALAVSSALVAGVDLRRVVLLGVALVFPAVVLGLAVLAILSDRRSSESQPALFCDVVAAELRSGAPMLGAIQSAFLSVVGPGYPQSLPGSLDEATSMVASRFDDLGHELAVTIGMAARAGGGSADLFDEIASVALAQSEIAYEVRVASAPAKATALVFLAAPLIYLGVRSGSAGLGQLVAVPEQRVVAGAGLALFILGLVAAGQVLRRAR